MQLRGRNGKLSTVADVARLLPRSWDGQRLLRFLAGLAMLALAFAYHAGLTAPTLSAAPAPPVPASATVDAPAIAPAADVAPATSVLAPDAAVLPAAAAFIPATSVLAPAAAAFIPAGAALTVGGTAADEVAAVVSVGMLIVAVFLAAIGGAQRAAVGTPGGTGARAHGSRGPPLR